MRPNAASSSDVVVTERGLLQSPSSSESVLEEIAENAPPTFYASVKIYGIPAIDDKRQTFDAQMRMFIEWNSSGCPASKLPWPKILLLNQIDKSQTGETVRRDPSHRKNGWWIMKVNVDGRFACLFNLTVFPFDNQNLEVQVRISHVLAESWEASKRGGGAPVKLMRGVDRPDVPGLPKIKDIFQVPHERDNKILSKIHTREWMFEDPGVKFDLQEKSVDESVKRTAWADVAWSVRASREYVSYCWNTLLLMFVLQLLGFGTYFIRPPPCDDCDNAEWLETHLQHLDTRIHVVLTLLLTTVAFKITLSEQMPRMPYLTLMDKYLLLTFGVYVVIAAEIFMVDDIYQAVRDSHGFEGSRRQLDKWLFCGMLSVWVAIQVYCGLRMWNEARIGGAMEDPLVAGLPGPDCCCCWRKLTGRARTDSSQYAEKHQRRFTRQVIGRTHTQRNLMVIKRRSGSGSDRGHGAGEDTGGVAHNTEAL